jgi:hypothetical protein
MYCEKERNHRSPMTKVTTRDTLNKLKLDISKSVTDGFPINNYVREASPYRYSFPDFS